MATIFADLDGSAFYFGSNTFVPNAYEQLKAFHDQGGQIIFTTARGSLWETAKPVEKYLKSLFPDCLVLFNISSPRIVLNDDGARAINHPRDAAWNYDFSEF